MRAIDVESERALAWFPFVYHREALGGTWQRVALPRAGGLGDQDVRTMQLFEVLASTLDAVAAETEQRRKRDDEIQAWRNERANSR